MAAGWQSRPRHEATGNKPPHGNEVPDCGAFRTAEAFELKVRSRTTGLQKRAEGRIYRSFTSRTMPSSASFASMNTIKVLSLSNSGFLIPA